MQQPGSSFITTSSDANGETDLLLPVFWITSVFVKPDTDELFSALSNARVKKQTRMYDSVRSDFWWGTGRKFKSLLLILKASSAWQSCIYHRQSLSGYYSRQLIRSR
jgi:hypothetical protein